VDEPDTHNDKNPADAIPQRPFLQTDDWATPQDYFDAVNAEFDLLWDVCASSKNAKLPLYWTGSRTDFRPTGGASESG
jgi:hypothetical protein